MFIAYKNRKSAKAPGCWYTFNYASGQRVTPIEYQGDMSDLESHARWLSLDKKREIRLVQYYMQSGKVHKRTYAVFRQGVRYNGDQ